MTGQLPFEGRVLQPADMPRTAWMRERSGEALEEAVRRVRVASTATQMDPATWSAQVHIEGTEAFEAGQAFGATPLQAIECALHAVRAWCDAHGACILADEPARWRSAADERAPDPIEGQVFQPHDRLHLPERERAGERIVGTRRAVRVRPAIPGARPGIWVATLSIEGVAELDPPRAMCGLSALQATLRAFQALRAWSNEHGASFCTDEAGGI